MEPLIVSHFNLLTVSSLFDRLETAASAAGQHNLRTPLAAFRSQAADFRNAPIPLILLNWGTLGLTHFGPIKRTDNKF